MAEIDVKTGDKEGEATLFECPMFQNYQGRAEFTVVFFQIVLASALTIFPEIILI